MTTGWRSTVLAGLAGLSLIAAGCGSDDNDSSGSSSNSNANATTTGGSDLAAFEAKIDEALADAVLPDPAKPPESGPKAATGKKVYAISCGNQIEGCARAARAFKEATADIGWDITEIDTQADPTKATAGIKAAIAADADGIFINAFDSPVVGEQVKEATSAGIPVLATNALDADNVFDDVIPSQQSFHDEGYLQGQALYKETEGKLHLIILSGDEFGVVKERRLGTEQFIEDCKAAGGDCEILETKANPAAQLVQATPTAAAGLARKHPDATAIWTGYDATPPFVIQGLKQAGINDIAVIGFDANEPNLEIIKSGGMQTSSTVKPSEWEIYQAVDNLNRIFAGEDPIEWAPSARLVTEEHSEPEYFEEYPESFKKLWGTA